MAHRIIRTADDLAALTTLLGSLKLPITVTWAKGADRSLEQNRMQFQWAREAAEQRGDMTPEEVRCEWKLHHGVPILRAENANFQEFYDAAIKPLSYEQKLKAMRIVGVTSEMTVRQMTQYLDIVQRECAERGIVLTDPETRRREGVAA